MMPGVVPHLLKRWRDDFVTVKCRGMVSGLFEKKRGAIPPHPDPHQALAGHVASMAAVRNDYRLVEN
jgi:hypothetical protein